MKKIFLSIALFLFGILHPIAPHDFKTAYTQTKQTLTYPAFLIRVANNAKTPLDTRKAACDELLTRDDLSPDNALDLVISLVALKNGYQKFDASDPAKIVSTIIECIEQSPALPIPAWAKVVLENAKECEDYEKAFQFLANYENELFQFLANSNIYACQEVLSQYHTLEACDPVYSCGAEERFYNQL